jgi:prefoldin alpha subunit
LSPEKEKLANKDEEELRRLSVELRFYEQTADALQSRLNMINAVMTDLTVASVTITSLETEKEGSELLVPVGGNSYIKAKLDNPSSLIVGMGAGVSVEKTVTESKEILKKRHEELERTRTSMQQQFVQVIDKTKELRDSIEFLVEKMRGEAPSKNV